MNQKRLLFLSIFLLLGSRILAQHRISTPSNSVQFGRSITVLSNGNYVVTDPFCYRGNASNVGAVYLYDGLTHTLLSTLSGNNANDQVGLGGVTALPNGNYLVTSYLWNNGSVTRAGAVTFCQGTMRGLYEVNSTNSLVGSSLYDYIGKDGITVLPNGNYVVNSISWDNNGVEDAGAVTWGSGTDGVVGVISSTNSLIGKSLHDQVGLGGIKALSNGNYVVNSFLWNNGSNYRTGAVTWGDGTTGVSGLVSGTNSLIGGDMDDRIGLNGVTPLTTGNYVVSSSNWNFDRSVVAGAVTFCNGSTGTVGSVTSSNSLVGSKVSDRVGSGGVTALSNGNYVISSPLWDNGTIANAGAVTLGHGPSGISGPITSTNSLVGLAADDRLSSGGITALSNDNFVVRSPLWDLGNTPDAGAVTLVRLSSGTSGSVSSTNSLIGSAGSDQVGSGGITALSNGNFVVSSPLWDNGSVVDAGAVTWADGKTGVTGSIQSTNSLVGVTASDQVGSGGVTALTNGNFMVSSPLWDNGSTTDVGAATLGQGTGSLTGFISATNSLVGNTANDQIGNGGATALSNGDFVVRSPLWNNGSLVDAGAITWGSGTLGVTEVVSTTNSLTGNTANAQIGSKAVTALPNGNYAARLPNGLTIASGLLRGSASTCMVVQGDLNFHFLVHNPVYQYTLAGFSLSRIVYVLTSDNVSGLATTATAVSLTPTSSTTYKDQSCQVIASVTPTGANVGNTTAWVWLDTKQSSEFVKRHYQITATSTTASARITLYFSQADFNAFNAVNTTRLPTGPNDESGKAHLLIEKKSGSSDDGSGSPNSYTEGSETIDPADTDIVWNPGANRWEVSLSAIGFNGFFIKTETKPLPVRLVRFTARSFEKSAVLEWQTVFESHTSHFELRRSLDGTRFESIGHVNATGNSSSEQRYRFIDSQFASLPATAYYQLRSVDTDGSYSESRIVALTQPNAWAAINVYPNPILAGTSVQVTIPVNTTQVSVFDPTGRSLPVILTAPEPNKTTLHLGQIPAGIYLLKINSDSVNHTQRLVVQ